jgi:hypothetical protein
MAKVNFRDLLNFKSEEIERPVPCPEGHFIGTCYKIEFGFSKQKKTPYARFHLRPEEPCADVDMDQLNGLDLSKQELHRDFYLTPKAKYMIADMLDTVFGPDPRTIDERIDDMKDAKLCFQVTQNTSDDGTRIFNNVGNIMDPEDAP